AEPGQYRWSSYRWHGQGIADPLITDHGEYWALGFDKNARQAAYRELFRHALDARAVEDIRAALNQCRVCGSERCKDEIEAALERRVRPGKVGRPKRSREPLIAV
ncbi:MAG: transposase, partial [Xanthomonadaceae bacterium]|nr:transposase [Xanthomonadaceae bacterium]